MFCEKCGKEIRGNVMFCTYCGAPVKLMSRETTNQSQQGYPQGGMQNQQGYAQGGMQNQQGYPQGGMQNQQGYPQGNMQNQQGYPNYSDGSKKSNAPKKSGKKGLIIGLVCGFVALIGIAVLVYFMFLRTTTIDLNDYMTIECSGYNSIGKASAYFDVDSFYDDYEDKVKFKSSKAEENSEFGSAAEHLFENYISGSLDKSENLSNGDEIVYKWVIDEDGIETDLNVEIDYSDIEYTVEGLEDAETFDLFSDIEVKFLGSDPNGYVEISNNSSIYPVNTWSFSADKEEGLSNGDKVVVSFDGGQDDIDECLQEYGKIPDITSKEFEVTGLSNYISSGSQISTDALDTMKNTARSNASSDVDYNDEIVSSATYDYAGYYFLHEKAGETPSHHNQVVLIYAVSCNIDGEEDDTEIYGTYGYYTATVFYDLYLDESGNCVATASNSQDTDNEIEFNPHVRDSRGNEVKYQFWGYDSLADLKRDLVDSEMSSNDLEESINSGVSPVKTRVDTTTNSSARSSGSGSYDLNTYYLSESEVKNMTQDEIQMAINDVYARHGYIFQTEAYQTYYENTSWYTPYSGDMALIESYFNATEKANVKLLSKYRD